MAKLKRVSTTRTEYAFSPGNGEERRYLTLEEAALDWHVSGRHGFVECCHDGIRGGVNVYELVAVLPLTVTLRNAKPSLLARAIHDLDESSKDILNDVLLACGGGSVDKARAVVPLSAIAEGAKDLARALELGYLRLLNVRSVHDWFITQTDDALPGCEFHCRGCDRDGPHVGFPHEQECPTRDLADIIRYGAREAAGELQDVLLDGPTARTKAGRVPVSVSLREKSG